VIQDTVLRGLTIAASVLMLLFVTAPYAFPYGTFVSLDGAPSAMDHDWSSYGPMGLVYAMGDILCHQEFDRSFILNGSQMPICMRDLALLAGSIVGLVVCLWIRDVLNDRRYLFVGILLLAPTAAEWVAEHMLSMDSPELRIILGIVSGIGAALIVGHALFRNGSGAEAP